MLDWRDDADLSHQISTRKIHISNCCVIAHTRIPSGDGFARVSIIPHDVAAFARAIYSELHRCDDEGADWIVVEAPPEGGEWKGIADRLKRASAI